MKSKLPIMVILFSLLAIFSLGCLSEISPDPGDVSLNPDNPSVTFSAVTDNKEVTWKLDGKEMKQGRGENGRVAMTLDYMDLSEGDHSFSLEDSDSSAHEWKIHVARKGKNESVVTGTGNKSARSWNDIYDHWAKKANEQMNKRKMQGR